MLIHLLFNICFFSCFILLFLFCGVFAAEPAAIALSQATKNARVNLVSVVIDGVTQTFSQCFQQPIDGTRSDNPAGNIYARGTAPSTVKEVITDDDLMSGVIGVASTTTIDINFGREIQSNDGILLVDVESLDDSVTVTATTTGTASGTQVGSTDRVRSSMWGASPSGDWTTNVVSGPPGNGRGLFTFRDPKATLVRASALGLQNPSGARGVRITGPGSDLSLVALFFCGPTSAPTPSLTPAPTPAATSAAPSPARTPAPTPAPSPVPTPEPSPAPTVAPTSSPTPSPTPVPTPAPTPDRTAPCVDFRICDQCVDAALHPSRVCRFCGTGCQEGGSCDSSPDVPSRGTCPTPSPTPSPTPMLTSSLTTQSTPLSMPQSSNSFGANESTTAVVSPPFVAPDGLLPEWWWQALVGAIACCCLILLLIIVIVVARRRRHQEQAPVAVPGVLSSYFGGPEFFSARDTFGTVATSRTQEYASARDVLPTSTAGSLVPGEFPAGTVVTQRTHEYASSGNVLRPQIEYQSSFPKPDYVGGQFVPQE
jgi:hypothetical protein